MSGENFANLTCESQKKYLKPFGPIGLDTIPNQITNKINQKGFVYNILCIGQTGIGKSTLMDTLFNMNFGDSENSHFLKESNVRLNTYELFENNVRVKLTIAKSTGYGDQLDTNNYEPILNFIDEQYEAYLQEELKIKRSLSNFRDTRIHLCLFLICPTGHGLKALDFYFMKKLCQKVNLIPLIAKADSLTKPELERFKRNIMKELQHENIEICKFPDEESDDDNQTSVQLPFAVMGSREFIQMDNQMVRVRLYPWGIVEVENELYSDVQKCREMIFQKHTIELRERTFNEYYEIYRRKRLYELGVMNDENEIKKKEAG